MASSTMPRPPSPGRALLADPDVRRWYTAGYARAASTADVRLRDLGAFCTRMAVSPADLASKPFLANRQKKLHDMMLDFIEAERQAGISSPTAANRIDAVKSWLHHNGILLVHKVVVSGQDDTPTLRDERTPTQDELHSIFLAGSQQARVAAVMMAHAGVRPEVLGNYRGTDGLRLSDFPELELTKTEVSFKSIPTRIVVRRELSKARHQFLTFLGEEGCRYVKEYLEGRLRAKEGLGPDSDLLSPVREPKAFMFATNVGDVVRRCIRKAGFRWRPYVLRAYFDTQLLVAESKGKLAHDYRVFWMGHKGSMEARYTTNKGRLPADLVEDMRNAYRRCEPFLSTVPSKSDTQTQGSMAKVLLMGLGYSEEELATIDFDTLDPLLFQELVQKKIGGGQAPKEKQKQKVVEAGEVPRYLDQGWTAVMSLGGNQVVLNPPGP